MYPDKNVFGHSIYPPLTSLSVSVVNDLVRRQLIRLFEYLCDSRQRSERIAERFLDIVKREIQEKSIERKGYDMLVKEEGLGHLIAGKLGKRAELIFSEIYPLTIKSSVLDVGCGDGLVGKLLSEKGKTVYLYDVVNYLTPDVKCNLILGREDRDIPFSEKFDNVLLLTVLHHASNPMRVLREARDLVGGRLIIIESVFGVHSTQEGTATLDEQTAAFVQWTDEVQLRFITFFDWFYNRVLHQDVSVPLNFNTPAQWRTIFDDEGFRVVGSVDLGIDQQLVPEYHVVFVLERS